jgi:hypothetical protein
VTIAGKRCQVEDEAAHWQPVGLAVVWSGSRVAVSKASVGQCSVAIGRQAVPCRMRDNALAAGRACCGLPVRPSGCGQRGERRAVLGDDRRQAVPGRRRGGALAADRACRGLWSGSRVAVSKASVVQCSVTIAGKRCQVEDEAAHWRPIGLAVAWSGSRVAGSKASVGRCLVAIAGKRCQAEDEAAHWRPIGLAVAWSGSRVAGRQRLPLAWSVSGSARWRSAGKRCQAEDEAAHWRPVGLAVAWSGSRVAGRQRLPLAWSVSGSAR